MENRAAKYLMSLTGEKSVRAIALGAGIEPSTLSRQVRGQLKAETIAAICRHYGKPVLPALIFLEVISEEEAVYMSVEEALERATDLQLATETLRRVQDASQHDALRRPIDESVESNVTRLRKTVDLETVDLDSYKSVATDDDGGQGEYPHG